MLRKYKLNPDHTKGFYFYFARVKDRSGLRAAKHCMNLDLMKADIGRLVRSDEERVVNQ
jgi:hypothetical protein